MRDFRDAKAMAQSLRQALAANDLTITHSQALELIAKAFNEGSWNILAARIEAERPATPAAAVTGAPTLYCSFCGKPQQEVAMLIAGPSVSICNECVELCDDIIDDRSLAKLESEARALDPNADPLAIVRERLTAMTTEQLAARKQRSERWLHHIDRSLEQLTTGLEGRPRQWPPSTKDPLAGKSPEQLAAQRREMQARRAEVSARLGVTDAILAERGSAPS
jgi:hypothetical protein